MSEINTPLTDAIRLTIAAGDWRKESDCTEAALSHADELERELIQAQQTIAQKDGEIGEMKQLLKRIVGYDELEAHELEYYLKNPNGSTAGEYSNKDASDILLALSTPAPVAVVPWEEVTAEVQRAIAKFPTWPTDPLHAFAVVGEEFGECQKEVLQMTYEPHKSSREAVKKEAIQLAAMSLRFVNSLDHYEYYPQKQHAQDSPKKGNQ